MTCSLLLLSTFLFELGSGHGWIGNANNPGARPRVEVGGPNKKSYRTTNNTGAPCGGCNVESFPSTEGPSSKFFGETDTLTPGAVYSMKITFTANHGGFHFAAIGCTKGQAPPTKTLHQGSVDPFWTLLKLSSNQPNKNTDGFTFMNCDAFIPASYGNKPVVINWDIPQNIPNCPAGEKAMIVWVWEATQNWEWNKNFLKRCDQGSFSKQVFKGKAPGAPEQATGAEVWYNCIDATVGSGGTSTGSSPQPAPSRATAAPKPAPAPAGPGPQTTARVPRTRRPQATRAPTRRRPQAGRAPGTPKRKATRPGRAPGSGSSDRVAGPWCGNVIKMHRAFCKQPYYQTNCAGSCR